MRIPYRVIGTTLVATLLAQLAGCGTLFWPDRRGQIEGQIDPLIAVLDAVGLLFYIIPGVIAFGVDIATGAIYLPSGTHVQVDPAKLRPAVEPDGSINRARLQAILQQELGRHLPLDDPRLIERRGSAEQLASYGLVPAA